MNTLKKLFSLCLAVMLVLSLAVPAMAADNATYNITIQGTSADHTYVAYQIFSGDMVEEPQTDSDGNPVKDDEGNTITVAKLGVTGWGSGINGDAFLEALQADATLGGTFATIDSPQTVANTISTWSKTNPNLLRFSELAAEHAREEGKITATPKVTDLTQYEFNGLPAGYYMFLDESTVTIDYHTEVLLEVVQNEIIHPKGDIPKLTKEVRPDVNDTYKDYASVTSTQYFAFRLEATLPSNYEHYDSYKLVFHDKLGSRFSYDASEADPKVLIKYPTSGSTDRTITTAELQENGDSIDHNRQTNELTLTINDLKEYTTHQSDKVIFIFKVKLNPTNMIVGNGDEEIKGNVNEAYLEYSNNPNGSFTPETTPIGRTQDVYAQVFTYSLTVNKVDSVQTTKKLPGAEFILYRHTEETAPEGTDPATETEAAPAANEENVQYAIVENGKLTGWTFNVNDATKLVTDETNGSFTVSGLNASTYHLKEVKQPAGGYNLLDYDPVVIIQPTFAQDAETKFYSISNLQYTLDYSEIGTGTSDTGNVTVTIKNSIGSTLPSTGGMGTTLIYAAGGIMVLLAVVLLVTKKRMHNN